MSAKSFIMKKMACIAAILITLGGVFYAFALTKAQAVPIDGYFYFLVSAEENVEAVAELARLDGGAGYLLEEGENRYVALAVYKREQEGEEMQKSLEKSGRETLLLKRGQDTLYFKGKNKERSVLYRSALALWAGWSSVLSECISRLEKGMTQESCKRILAILKRQFAYGQSAYAEYSEFALLCGQSEQAITQIYSGTIYVRDLRYLFCWQAEKYVELCSAFSLA